MTIEQAIKKAIEGGYKGWEKKDLPLSFPQRRVTFLDKYFWKCLGKAMGWRMEDPFNKEENTGDRKEAWLHYWIKFVRHLAEGKSAERFFEEIK